MMSIIKNKLNAMKKQRGATMVEYAIMVALIAVVAIAIISSLGTEVSTTFSGVNNAMNSANIQGQNG